MSFNLTSDAPPSYDLNVRAKHGKNMFLKSKNENPQFPYASNFSGMFSIGGDRWKVDP
jgi:hypothetical protein